MITLSIIGTIGLLCMISLGRVLFGKQEHYIGAAGIGIFALFAIAFIVTLVCAVSLLIIWI